MTLRETTTAGMLRQALGGAADLRLTVARLLWLVVSVTCITAMQVGFSWSAIATESMVEGFASSTVSDDDLSGGRHAPADPDRVATDGTDAPGEDLLAAWTPDCCAMVAALGNETGVALRGNAPATPGAGARAPPARG